MIRVLLCHASQDSATAGALARRLESCAEARLSLAATEAAAPDLLHLWDVEDADAVLLLLAPECVPAHSSRASWQPVLDQLQARNRPDVGAVVLRPCAYPPLLQRAAFFREDLTDTHLRDLAAWLLNLHPDPGWPEWSILHPARPAPGAVQPSDTAPLWSALADQPGRFALDGAAAPTLAQAFAREAAGQFRATLRLDAAGRPPDCLAGELAAALGVRVEGSLEDAWSQVASVLDAHRLLLILDGWEGDLPWQAGPAGRSSVLTLSPPVLPACETAPPLPLWSAALACRAAGFPLALAESASALARGEALRQARFLCDQGLLAETDPVNLLYRRLASGAAAPQTRLAHAQALNSIFLDRRQRSSLAALCAAELPAALDFAAAEDWDLAVRLASRAHLFFEQQERRLEAVHILRRIIQAAAARGDKDAAGAFRKKLAWLVDDSGAVHVRWSEGEQGSLFA